jgi:hypothetical protein
MPQRDKLDPARVLLTREIDEETLVRSWPAGTHLAVVRQLMASQKRSISFDESVLPRCHRHLRPQGHAQALGSRLNDPRCRLAARQA